jgi:hypothetical protein
MAVEIFKRVSKKYARMDKLAGKLSLEDEAFFERSP